jgi:hypothetical protein
MKTIVALALIFAPLFVQANLCRKLTGDTAYLREQLGRDFNPSEEVYNDAWNEMLDLRKKGVELYDKVISKTRNKPVLPEAETLALLANPEMTYYHDQLAHVLEIALKDRSEKSMNQKILSALKDNLHNAVPSDTVEKRIESLKNEKPGALLQALGQMTLPELQRLVYGRNPLKPSPESLLGQYINTTGAATVVRTFPRGPNRQEGPKKLVVSLSPRSFKKYSELFTLVNFLIHVHSPNQGTLYLAHEGLSGSYANHSEDLRAPSPGALLPHILLSTSEGQRARLFFELGKSGGEAKEPWDLDNYCAKGGYSSCTHWVGNIPVGDKLVNRYSFPGQVDDHADNSVGKGVQSQRLEPYENDNLITSLVWKVPGHQQLADVIGLHRANISAELANPGWVAYSLLGSAGVDRVPFVFLTTSNHRSPIPKDFDLQISAY